MCECVCVRVCYKRSEGRSIMQAIQRRGVVVMAAGTPALVPLCKAIQPCTGSDGTPVV